MSDRVTPIQLWNWQQALNLSGYDAAKALGVNPMTYSRWINGRHTPPLRLAEQMKAITDKSTIKTKPRKVAAAMAHKIELGIAYHVAFYTKEGARMLDRKTSRTLPEGATYWQVTSRSPDTAAEWRRSPGNYSDVHTGLIVPLAQAGIAEPPSW